MTKETGEQWEDLEINVLGGHRYTRLAAEHSILASPCCPDPVRLSPICVEGRSSLFPSALLYFEFVFFSFAR